MPKFIFNKLIRDKFQKIYEELGQRITTRSLTAQELKDELRKKIIEEATELPTPENKNNEIIDEIADVQQVLDDLKSIYGISSEEVSISMEKKYEKKGGFQEGLYVETIELNDEDKWVEYYRKDPYKYPEVGKDHLDQVVIPELEPGTYEHYKGNKYDVVGVALHSETLEPMVAYRPLYETKAPLWVRPYDMFVGTVEIDGKVVKRFTKV